MDLQRARLNNHFIPCWLQSFLNYSELLGFENFASYLPDLSDLDSLLKHFWKRIQNSKRRLRKTYLSTFLPSKLYRLNFANKIKDSALCNVLWWYKFMAPNRLFVATSSSGRKKSNNGIEVFMKLKILILWQDIYSSLQPKFPKD